MRHETFAGPATIAVPDLHVLNDNPLACPEGQPREEHRLQPQNGQLLHAQGRQ